MIHAGLHYTHPTRLDLLQEPARSQISVVKREAQFEDDYIVVTIFIRLCIVVQVLLLQISQLVIQFLTSTKMVLVTFSVKLNQNVQCI